MPLKIGSKWRSGTLYVLLNKSTQLFLYHLRFILKKVIEIHSGRVPYICITKHSHHWRFLVPSHYRNQCWLKVKCTLDNILQWIFFQNAIIFIDRMNFENGASKITVILSPPQWVNKFTNSFMLLTDKWFPFTPSPNPTQKRQTNTPTFCSVFLV